MMIDGITTNTITVYKIPAQNNMDMINFYLESLGPGRGRIIIECYGEIWSSFWPAMGCSIHEFVYECPLSYLVTNLLPPKRATKKEKEYLTKICQIVREAIGQEFTELANEDGK
jgi:hypothetical protein